MHLYISIVIFIIGLILASFLNALLYRIDNGYKYPDIFIKGSHCEKCKKKLLWYELIPVLSYFIFRGKCSKCGYKVPFYYPVTELLLGISLGSIYYFELSSTMYVLVVFLFVMSYFDRLYKGVPKVIVHVYLLSSFLIFTLYSIYTSFTYPNSLVVSIVFTIFVLILSKVMKKAFGMGDLLILFGMGFLLSIPMYILFIYTFLFISLLYSFVLIFLKKATIKSSLPLVPLMYISISLMLIFNQQLVLILEKIFYI